MKTQARKWGTVVTDNPAPGSHINSLEATTAQMLVHTAHTAALRTQCSIQPASDAGTKCSAIKMGPGIPVDRTNTRVLQVSLTSPSIHSPAAKAWRAGHSEQDTAKGRAHYTALWESNTRLYGLRNISDPNSSFKRQH